MKNNILQSLPSFKNQGKATVIKDKSNPSGAQNQTATDSTQARVQAMHGIQRASGRRGN